MKQRTKQKFRDKHSYENNKDTPLDVSLSISNPHAFTRKNTAPYDKSLCFFCQKIHDSKGRDRLNEVETINTGIKICDAVKRSDSDILKVRLFNAIQGEDGRAADFKYHLLCYAKWVGQREKITDNDYDKCLLKQYAEVELLSEIESQIRNGVVLSIADIEVT